LVLILVVNDEAAYERTGKLIFKSPERRERTPEAIKSSILKDLLK